MPKNEPCKQEPKDADEYPSDMPDGRKTPESETVDEYAPPPPPPHITPESDPVADVIGGGKVEREAKQMAALELKALKKSVLDDSSTEVESYESDESANTKALKVSYLHNFLKNVLKILGIGNKVYLKFRVFLAIRQKTQGQKNSNSRKFSLKLKDFLP